MGLRRSAVITEPSASDREDACGVCRWQRENEKQKFIVIKFILAIGKNICQRKLFVCYHIDTTPLLVDMVNCYWTSQFYHKSVRSCFILLKKESRIYAGSGVSQTPITRLGSKDVCQLQYRSTNQSKKYM